MPKNITSEVREIILKVKEFMDEEKRMQVPIIPLSKVYVRVSAATAKRGCDDVIAKILEHRAKGEGVSERTVLNIVKEARLVEQGLLDPDTLKKTPKRRVRTKGKIEVDEYDLQVIRRKIHEFYAYKKEVPTINKLLQILKEEINFKGSRETLRKILRKNGFQFRKTKNNKEKEQQPEPTSSVPPMVPPYIHTMFSHKTLQS